MLLFKSQGYFKNKFSNPVHGKKVTMSEARARVLGPAERRRCRDTALSSRCFPEPRRKPQKQASL